MFRVAALALIETLDFFNCKQKKPDALSPSHRAFIWSHKRIANDQTYKILFRKSQKS